MISTRAGMNITRGISLACVLALLVVGGVWWTLRDADSKHVTAFFPRTVGLYEGSGVDVLGAQVGEVQKITPQGDKIGRASCRERAGGREEAGGGLRGGE